jgi:hypothetical protein
MNNTTKKLQEWAVNKIKGEYPDDVALLIAVDGINCNGDEHGECFGYYVPATERGYELNQTFIVGGVGHDLYPRSWELCESTANLNNNAAFVLSGAKIVYSRSTDDAEKFERLRQKLFTNLNDNSYVYRKALEKLDAAMNFYRTLMFEEQFHKAFTGLGFIEFYLCVAVMLLNHCHYAWYSEYFDEIRKLSSPPAGLIEYHNAMLTVSTVNDCRNLAHMLISAVRKYIAEFKPDSASKINAPDNNLKEWYQELSLKWRRLYFHCEAGNAELALCEAVDLQSELNAVGAEYNLNSVNLLDSFSASDLPKFSARASEIENYIKAVLNKNGIKLRSYATVEEFLAEN